MVRAIGTAAGHGGGEGTRMNGSSLARRAASFVAVLYALGAAVPVVIGVLVMRGNPGPAGGLLWLTLALAVLCAWLVALASGLPRGRMWARVGGTATFALLAALLARPVADCAGGWGLVLFGWWGDLPARPQTVGCALGLAVAFVVPALLGMVLLAMDAGARVSAGD